MIDVVLRGVLAPLVRWACRPEVRGLSNVPAHGPVILAANHRSEMDTGVIAVVMRRPVRFLGKAEYFNRPGLLGRLTARTLDGLGYVPVDRGNVRAGLAALDAGRAVLAAGGVFALYPEGTRSRDGRLHRGHTGVASLALSTGAKVVPVALCGTERVLPPGARVPRWAKIGVTFGEPLDFSRYDGQESSPFIRRSVTDEIMYALMELTGLEYVDQYHKRPDQNAA